MAIIEQYQNQIWILKLLQPGKACLLVGGPLLTLWPTFELREKYSKSSLIWRRKLG